MIVREVRAYHTEISAEEYDTILETLAKESNELDSRPVTSVQQQHHMDRLRNIVEAMRNPEPFQQPNTASAQYDSFSQAKPKKSY